MRRQALVAGCRALRSLQQGLLHEQPQQQLGALARPSSSLTIRQDYGEVLRDAAALPPSTPAPPGEMGLTSGVPPEILRRHVVIYAPARTASQQGQSRTQFNTAAPSWKIKFETKKKWENPLIGWTSTADPVENVARASLVFFNKDEAIAFAEKNGWSYDVQEPNKPRLDRTKRFAGYGDNFSIRRAGVPDLSTLPSNRAPTDAEAAPKEQPQAKGAPKEQSKIKDNPKEQSQAKAAPKEDPQLKETTKEQPQVKAAPKEQPQAKAAVKEQTPVKAAAREQTPAPKRERTKSKTVSKGPKGAK